MCGLRGCQQTPDGSTDKGKPIAKSGRKVTGLTKIAGPPKYEIAQAKVPAPAALSHFSSVSLMHQAKILIADDSRAVRVCLERVLRGAGYEVSVACDGLEALRLAREVAPDLVILDIQMPEMDGYEACEQILKFASLPVIFLTRSRATQLDALGHQFGAYIPKPANDQELLDTVHELLQSASTTSS